MKGNSFWCYHNASILKTLCVLFLLFSQFSPNFSLFTSSHPHFSSALSHYIYWLVRWKLTPIQLLLFMLHPRAMLHHWRKVHSAFFHIQQITGECFHPREHDYFGFLGLLAIHCVLLNHMAHPKMCDYYMVHFILILTTIYSQKYVNTWPLHS